MRRKDAAKLIDDIAIAVESATDDANCRKQIVILLRRAGVSQPLQCQGEAHSNPYIDHCGTCAPRWGWILTPTKIP